MKLIGYSDPLSVAPGETVSFKVSSVVYRYQADIVRLVHGDESPAGPGFKESLIATAVSGDYQGRIQQIRPGSYAYVEHDSRLNVPSGFTIQCWIFPTSPNQGRQGLITKMSSGEEGFYALLIDDSGCVALEVGDGMGATGRVESGKMLTPREWHFVVGSFDPQAGELRLIQEELPLFPIRQLEEARRPVELMTIGANDSPLLMAAFVDFVSDGVVKTTGHFNGKLEAPSLFNRPLTSDEIALLRTHEAVALGELVPTASWDFSIDVSSDRVVDTSPNSLEGRLINLPARAVTGVVWKSTETDWRRVPEEYAAVHFHDDDLDDVGWDTDFKFEVPDGLASGIYAARLRGGNAEDHVPFFVKPGPCSTKSPILFLAPTATYLAYGNEHVLLSPDGTRLLEGVSPELAPNLNPRANKEEYDFILQNRLNSMYDVHSDGSGVMYASRLRPIANMRPKSVMRTLDCPVGLAADLHLVDWMEHKGFAFDVATDEDLHIDGAQLLDGHRVVVTGAHPEYWSSSMLDAMDEFLHSGGRLVYLGGNGFYWVTSFGSDLEHPHLIEVRRWHGTQGWGAPPGEYHHSTTGEIGGLWRFRGRAPQRLVGVGFSTQGFDRSAAYHRAGASRDSRVSFIFDGVAEDELIGDFPSLVLKYGAAGFELDRVDQDLGTPAHALLLASSCGHSDSYQRAIEELNYMDAECGGTQDTEVRADMVFFETPNGGAVFSVGSIAWCGGLSYNNYENTVSRITENVLKRFSSPQPFPLPPV